VAFAAAEARYGTRVSSIQVPIKLAVAVLIDRVVRFTPSCGQRLIVLSKLGKQVDRIDMFGAPDIVWDIEQTCTRIWVNNSPLNELA